MALPFARGRQTATNQEIRECVAPSIGEGVRYLAPERPAEISPVCRHIAAGRPDLAQASLSASRSAQALLSAVEGNAFQIKPSGLKDPFNRSGLDVWPSQVCAMVA